MKLDTLAPFLLPISYIAENDIWKKQGWRAPYRSPSCPFTQGKMNCKYVIPETCFSNKDDGVGQGSAEASSALSQL